MEEAFDRVQEFQPCLPGRQAEPPIKLVYEERKCYFLSDRGFFYALFHLNLDSHS